jgi:hypothetical protein
MARNEVADGESRSMLQQIKGVFRANPWRLPGRLTLPPIS